MAERTQRIALTLVVSEIAYIDEIASTLQGTRSQVARVMVEAFKTFQSQIQPSRAASEPGISGDVRPGAAQEHMLVAAPTIPATREDL
jgi:hypothetical protein